MKKGQVSSFYNLKAEKIDIIIMYQNSTYVE
jgi:hypothetical protein